MESCKIKSIENADINFSQIPKPTINEQKNINEEYSKRSR